MKATKRLLPLFLALLILAVSLAGAAASAYYAGQWVGFGTVTGSTHSNLATGVAYDNTTVKGSVGGNQRLHTLTFNPVTSNYMPLVYTKNSGYGATTINSAKEAETIGYDVKGGVNASFFSFTGKSCNTYGGVNISDGKILQGCNSNDAAWVLAFNSDGTSALAYSKVSYTLNAKNNAWSAPVECINICPETTYGGIYYYDEFCGTKTDTKAAGVEIVFEKQDHTQLTVGGTLVGKVVAVRSSVSAGGTIGKGQFVLYASNASAYAASLRSLAVGDTVRITATETMAAAKTVMENCNSAFVTYGYHIVANGANVTDSDGLGYSFNSARAQRSGIGVKADGTLVLVASPGRTGTNTGLTVYELANYFISQGCVTAIDLDGGGSTQMTIEKSGSLTTAISSTRRVANSILVVARPTVSASDKAELNGLLDEANTLRENFLLGGATGALDAAVTYGTGVRDSAKSMPGDYTKAIMRLQEALANVTKTGYRPGIYRLNTASTLQSGASASASAVSSLAAGRTFTVTQTSGNYGYTKVLANFGWVDLTKATRIGGAVNAQASIVAPAVAYKGQNITISWKPVNGAAAYTYKVIELFGEPNPGDSNESANAVTLASGTTTDDLQVTIPASARTDGRYLKIGVCVEYPTASIWNTAYIATSTLPFTDVPLGHWGFDAVRHAYESGYFSGVSGTEFAPNGTMTRCMMTTVLHRMAGVPAVDPEAVLPFVDVPENTWYYEGVLWCASAGITSGVSATEFAPDGLITREQAAVFLYRFAQTQGYDTTVDDLTALDRFADGASVSGYAQTAMAWAVQNGILSGTDVGLEPKANATRVQIAALLYRFDTTFAK